jgi:hypothetical protein
VEEKRPRLQSQRRPILDYTVHGVSRTQVKDQDSDPRCLLPAVLFTLEVSIKKLA